MALGEPGAGYPVPWLVQTWLAGTIATDADPASSESFAQDLATFIHALRQADTAGRQFNGRGRGGILTDHDEWMETCFHRSEPFLDVPPLRRLWAHLRTLPRTSPDVMTHGDLIPGNVLVSDNRLAGILDTGGFAPADPALDLVAAWHLLRKPTRQLLRSALNRDDLEWERGRAWAFEQAMGLPWYYADSNPPMALLGRRTLARLLDPDG
ncbi:phosphotransferase [Actinoplanes sp. CA-142083]|uniref:phosphotransferase n=1 Tax=Actinoplanes sp. CA-142083 TaxID=3239903 RepID=UPI003D8AE93E